MDYKMQFAESLSNIFTNELTQKQILDLIESPKQDEFEMQRSHALHLRSNIKAPAIIAKEVAEKLSDPFYESRSRWSLRKCIFNRDTVSDAVLKRF